LREEFLEYIRTESIPISITLQQTNSMRCTLKSRTTALLVIALVPMALMSCDHEDRLAFKKGELFYDKKQVSQPVAQKVGDKMTKLGMFSDDKASSEKLQKPDSIYKLMLVYNKANLSPVVEHELDDIAMQVAIDALDNKPLDLVLTDSLWVPFQTQTYRPLGSLIPAKTSRFFYASNVSAEMAGKLRDYLVGDGFFDGGDKIVRLEKTADGYVFDLYSDPGVRDDARQQVLRNEMASWSQKVFGGVPLTLALCDIHMKPFLSIAPLRS
jgi:hypothetical protein